MNNRKKHQCNSLFRTKTELEKANWSVLEFIQNWTPQSARNDEPTKYLHMHVHGPVVYACPGQPLPKTRPSLRIWICAQILTGLPCGPNWIVSVISPGPIARSASDKGSTIGCRNRETVQVLLVCVAAIWEKPSTTPFFFLNFVIFVAFCVLCSVELELGEILLYA